MFASSMFGDVSVLVSLISVGGDVVGVSLNVDGLVSGLGAILLATNLAES